jgi:hypothetical protein
MFFLCRQKEDLQDSRKEAKLSKKKLESERKKIRKESDVCENELLFNIRDNIDHIIFNLICFVCSMLSITRVIEIVLMRKKEIKILRFVTMKYDIKILYVY